jgi:DNA-binding response OmpR family regulator
MQTDSSSGDKPELQRKRILIIEDNTDTQVIFKIYLRDHYDVDTSNSAEKGLEMLKAHNYSLLLLDINLQGKPAGTELLPRLRNEMKLKIPVLVVTAYSSSQDKGKFLSLGANDFIAKPVDKNTLIEKIKAMV